MPQPQTKALLSTRSSPNTRHSSSSSSTPPPLDVTNRPHIPPEGVYFKEDGAHQMMTPVVAAAEDVNRAITNVHSPTQQQPYLIIARDVSPYEPSPATLSTSLESRPGATPSPRLRDRPDNVEVSRNRRLPPPAQQEVAGVEYLVYRNPQGDEEVSHW